ncbi:MAG TPA: hypothetical protein VFB79_05205 [Candidatus Angelobacter sp.]|nr:hypothetical protein [Candidatus Angelobacter sp.]
MDKHIDSIKTHKDLAQFVSDMVKEYRQDPDAWENNTLESFLEALSACIESMDGYYKNFNLPFPSKPDWKVFAFLLSAAQVYE